MNSNYTEILLIGFRASGKTSIGKALAQKLGWDFIDMDDLIEQKTGKTINELTNEGTTWEEFRDQEHHILESLLLQKNIVVGVGGGTAVNNIVGKRREKTYGQLNAELLMRATNALIILLRADEEIITERIRTQEMENPETARPVLDEKRATELQMDLIKYKDDPQKRKEIIINEIIKDSPQMMHMRKSLYEALTNNIIDTGKLSLEECVEKIIQFLN